MSALPGSPLMEPALSLLGLDAREVTATTGGSSLPVFRITDIHARTYALRIAPPAAAVVLDRESRCLTAAAAAGVPCPKIVRRADAPAVSVLLTSWEPGAPLLSVFQDNPNGAAALARAAGRLQAELHAGGASAALAELDQGWAYPQSSEEASALQACPDDGPRTLVHLDFHPLNLLAEGGRLTAILDWVNAGAGDARRDVARTIAIMALDAGPMDSPLRGVVMGLLDEWVQGYEERAGPLHALRPYLVWAGLATIRDLAVKRSLHQLAWMRATVSGWADDGQPIPAPDR
ncbi:MAG: phosphotransferase family protein [Clostridia bacterium]